MVQARGTQDDMHREFTAAMVASVINALGVKTKMADLLTEEHRTRMFLRSVEAKRLEVAERDA